MALSGQINPSGGDGVFRNKEIQIEIPVKTGEVWSGKCNLYPDIYIDMQGGYDNLVVETEGNLIKLSTPTPMPSGSAQMAWFIARGDDGCTQPWTFYITAEYTMPTFEKTISNLSNVGRVVSLVTYPKENQTINWIGDDRFDVIYDEGLGYLFVTTESLEEFTGTITGTIVSTGSVTGNVTIHVVDLNDVPETPTFSIVAGDGAITITFEDADVGGSPITSHPIYFNGDLYEEYTGSSPYTITDLTNDVAITVCMSSKNAIGESVKTADITVTPQTF